MAETIRFARLGREDLNLGVGTFEVRLADGRVVVLNQIDIGEILSDASLSSRNVTLDTLTVETLTVTGAQEAAGTLQFPEKADPSSLLSGEIWINDGGTFPEYSGAEATPTQHALVGDDTTQTLTNKTLTAPVISAPVLSGTATGTYVLGGTPSLGAALDASDEDITAIDEAHFTDASANASAAGRMRRNATNLTWHDSSQVHFVTFNDKSQTLTNKTLTSPTITSPTINGKTITSPAVVLTGDIGTIALFQQTAAPTGWTKITTHNNKALRVVSGTASSGGATAFSTIFASGLTTGSHVLTLSEVPDNTVNALAGSTTGLAYVGTGTSLRSTGGGGHTHTLSMDLQYVDIILASKD